MVSQPVLLEMSVSGQMISGIVSWLLGSSSAHIIILAVGCWSWRELDGWSLGVSVVDSFEFYSMYCSCYRTRYICMWRTGEHSNLKL